MISGSYHARGSGVKVAVGGPNLNPVVFIGVDEIAEQSNMDYPEERRLSGLDRTLAGSTTEFGYDDHLTITWRVVKGTTSISSPRL